MHVHNLHDSHKQGSENQSKKLGVTNLCAAHDLCQLACHCKVSTEGLSSEPLQLSLQQNHLEGLRKQMVMTHLQHLHRAKVGLKSLRF